MNIGDLVTCRERGQDRIGFVVHLTPRPNNHGVVTVMYYDPEVPSYRTQRFYENSLTPIIPIYTSYMFIVHYHDGTDIDPYRYYNEGAMLEEATRVAQRRRDVGDQCTIRYLRYSEATNWEEYIPEVPAQMAENEFL